MRFSRRLCEPCGDRDALFAGLKSRCCNWSPPPMVVAQPVWNGPAGGSPGRPPRLSDAFRREMRIQRAQGLSIKTIAAQSGMSESQTRFICKGVVQATGG